MATINLGRVKPVFRGAYAGGTAYVVDDIVTSGNETFICIQASTGNATSNASYWTKLAAKGTDGTDVGTTLTTQGDILYRDGSGLARLGYGTAGQVLQTGGSGANPSWGTISSDFVKLHTINHSGSNIASYSFDGYFNDTIYSHYKLIGYHKVASGQSSSGNPYSIVRYNTNGSENSGGDYTWVWESGYWNGSAGDQNRGAQNDTKVRLLNTWNETGGHPDNPLVYDFTIHYPQHASFHCHTTWTSSNSFAGNEMATGLGGFVYEGSNISATTLVTGMTFRYESGIQFDTVYSTLYGVKK